MLLDLRVRDLGVIEDLTLRLRPGMTAITGETGTGKTLLVEALQLVLGGRADPSLVRAGADEALVEVRFSSDDAPGRDGRYARGDRFVGTPDDRDTELVVARSVPSSGRSRAWVDGRMVPASVLAEAGGDLVDIHGQHEHQSLVSTVAQRQSLDTFGGLDTTALDEAPSRLRQVETRLDELGGDGGERAREIDILRHQLGEIERAQLLDDDEEEALLAEESRLADLGAHREAAAGAVALLDGSGTGELDGAIALVGLARATVEGREAFDAWAARLRAAHAELTDLASDLRRAAETWEDDPQRLSEVQERRRRLAELRRRYGPTLADVRSFGEAARDRLGELEGADEMADVLVAERETARDAVAREEAALRRARTEAAPRLAAAVEARMQGLAMPGARFEVSISEAGAGEPVRFLLGANRGEPVLALGKAASGGELARCMLALRLVTMGGPHTMVFDEVDAGVGGEAAMALAQALTAVGRERQVLVVTHLAQVAALADHQIAVHKAERDGRTITLASSLEPPERVVEISRMLSGRPGSDTARAHAEELLALGGAGQASTR